MEGQRRDGDVEMEMENYLFILSIARDIAFSGRRSGRAILPGSSLAWLHTRRTLVVVSHV
jgi:hypothetical protein